MTGITREEIERILASDPFPNDHGSLPWHDLQAVVWHISNRQLRALLEHALTEQSRIDEAVEKGIQAGIEKAAQWHLDQAAAIDERIAKRGQVEFVSGLGRVACLHRQFATDMLAALSPTPTTEEGA